MAARSRLSRNTLLVVSLSAAALLDASSRVHAIKIPLFENPVSAPKTELTARWEKGSCWTNGKKLIYSTDQKKASTDLDFEAGQLDAFHCSSSFTVILSEDHAIVAIGGRKVLDGINLLGPVSGKFREANAYRLPIREARSEKIKHSYLSDGGGRFHIVTEKAHWSITLSDPEEWDYKEHKK